MVFKVQGRKEGKKGQGKKGKKDGRKEGREEGRGEKGRRNVKRHNTTVTILCAGYFLSVTCHSLSNPVSQPSFHSTDKKVRLRAANDSSKVTKPLKRGAGRRPQVLSLLHPLCVLAQTACPQKDREWGQNVTQRRKKGTEKRTPPLKPTEATAYNSW